MPRAQREEELQTVSYLGSLQIPMHSWGGKEVENRGWGGVGGGGDVTLLLRTLTPYFIVSHDH